MATVDVVVEQVYHVVHYQIDTDWGGLGGLVNGGECGNSGKGI